MLKTPIKIRNLQRKLYRRAKQKSAYKFYTLYDKVYNTPRKQHKKNQFLIPKELRYIDYFKG